MPNATPDGQVTRELVRALGEDSADGTPLADLYEQGRSGQAAQVIAPGAQRRRRQAMRVRVYVIATARR